MEDYAVILFYCFIIALVLSISILIIAGFIYPYKKLSKFYSLLLLFILIATPIIVFKIYEKNFMLREIPDALGWNNISYSKEKSWGFGPGGNEAGIRIYPLPENITEQITQHGIEFLKNMPPNKNKKKTGGRGTYSNWSETPIKSDKYWKQQEGVLNIYDYICMYGFCIDIKPTIVELANSVVNKPGSYYAYGRIGLIVVSPSKKVILYMYNG